MDGIARLRAHMFLDFVLILDLGLSRGEILGLKWGDVDFEANAVKINRLVVARNGTTCIADPENKREFAMMEITAKLLAERKGNRGNDEFIQKKNGKRNWLN